MIRRIKAPTARDDINPDLAIMAFNESHNDIPVEFYGQIIGSARILGQGGEPDEYGKAIQEFLVFELSMPNLLGFKDVFLECDHPDSISKVILLDKIRHEHSEKEFYQDRDRGIYQGLY
ncbi:MAG: hypothetical protein AABZ60_18680 [Planctomycetota bacterium]